MSEEFVLIEGEYRKTFTGKCFSVFLPMTTVISIRIQTSESTPRLQVKHLACKDLIDLQGEGQVFPHYVEMQH